MWNNVSREAFQRPRAASSNRSDSAYVPKCYLNDPDSERVRALVREPVELVSSSICIAEVCCVIRRRIRERALTRRQGQGLCDLFRAYAEGGVWTLVPLSDRLLWDVGLALKTTPPGVFVRAGDAIHLVSARQRGFNDIWTNDRHMLSAAAHFGLMGQRV
jgi:predicted nucleic acid-binding protein